jgi:hypothetical protein
MAFKEGRMQLDFTSFTYKGVERKLPLSTPRSPVRASAARGT